MHIPSNFVQVHNAFSLRYKRMMKLFFLTKGVFEEVRTAMLFLNPLYSFTFLVWDGLNNAFDYWPIVVDDTCKYGVFDEVRIVKFFNPLGLILTEYLGPTLSLNLGLNLILILNLTLNLA
jgi:hypothetical protein